MFIFTSYLSVKAALDYRRTGSIPFSSQHDPTFAAQSSEAFNSNPNPAHEFDDEESHHQSDTTLSASHIGGYSSLGGRDEDYTPLHQRSEVNDMHRPVPYDPSIYSAASPSPRPPSTVPSHAPAGMSHLHHVDTSYGDPFDDNLRYDDDPYSYSRR